ncbi:YkgJ family cysteine cluster protein [Methanolobus sp. WCC4]|uniref:YkgJ family cysteine cluster protein n=1 Tax=Methanolobus sp. WCC4 TaxID=3125784 RepID=UPI0030FBB20B
MDTRYKKMLIKQLEEEIEAAKKTDTEELAKQIRNIGFQCIMCGKCCRRGSGDNRVAVVPEEIRKICDGTGMKWDEIAEPLNIETDSPEEEHRLQAESGMIDEEGNIHTFGWMLRRKKNRDCSFIPDETADNRCKIYEHRPLLCSTYPFYMEGLELQVSECEGLGREISEQDSKMLAEMVLERYIRELQDTILTYQNYTGFRTGEKGVKTAMSGLKQGYLNYIVHYSEGTNKITRKI